MSAIFVQDTVIFVILGLSEKVMRKYISKINLLFIAGAALFIFSCTPQPCSENTESYLKASLYDKETNGLRAANSLTMYAINIDTAKIYDNAPEIQPVLIPLNASTDNCTFIITMNGVTDTLEFWYNSFPSLVSKECGYTFFHSLDSLEFTNNLIDTILIYNNRITTTNEDNIRIFY
jgi:hypothetical protein